MRSESYIPECLYVQSRCLSLIWQLWVSQELFLHVGLGSFQCGDRNLFSEGMDKSSADVYILPRTVMRAATCMN